VDGRSFDYLLRSLTESRRSLVGAALAAGGLLAGLTTTEAKKKMKPCKKKCKTGCCTKKYGKCVQPAQQGSTQCGSGGEICRSTNCGGGGDQCAATCEGCCAGNTCVMTDSQTQCGRNGVDCFACDDNQECAGTHCCGKVGRACAGAGECCLALGCEDDKCCVNNGQSCADSSDCCKLGSDQICDNGKCVVPTGSACQPGWLCEGNLSCPGSGICGEPEDCTQPCEELGRCSEQVCLGVLNCCTQATFDECSGSEDFCGCITEGGECTRILL
jgi:hypothetical protein